MTAELPLQNTSSLWKPKRDRAQLTQLMVQIICGAFAAVSILTSFGIVATLIFDTIEFFSRVSLWNFLSDDQWTPLFSSQKFGIFVLISATVMIAFIAVLVAIPLGLLSAICLSEYASPKLRQILKPLLEILAGVPTIVYGYFALLTVTPVLRVIIEYLQGFLPFIPDLKIFNALSAALVLGVMITPMIASLSEDAIYSVPQRLRDGAYALGATKRETITSVVLPAALSGIVSSIILAISRAVGETMIVSVAAGANPVLGFNPFESVMTMTAFIVQIVKGDAPYGTTIYYTLFAVGTTLFVMTLVLNIFSFWFVRRFREKYD